MRNEALETRVRAHIIEQVPVCLDAWRDCLTQLTGPSRQQGEYPLVHLASLVQRARPLFRLLGDEHAETVSVALETLLTMLLDGDLLYAGEPRRSMLASAEAMRITLAAHTEKNESMTDTPWPPDQLRHLQIETVYRLLHTIRGNTVANAYGGPCVAFPVRHSGQDSAPLRLRGFDLYRIEMEDLKLYLVEMPWHEVEERPSGLFGLLEYASRNGHVFDARPAWSALHCPGGDVTASPPRSDVLRLLCGSSLDPDFLEILLQVPVHCIHQVNPLLVRRHKASWKPAEAADAEPSEQIPDMARKNTTHRSVEELTLEYTTALRRMFATSKDAPRDEKLPDHLF